MKFARLNNSLQSTCFRHILQNGYGLGFSSYSTTSTSTATLKSSPRSQEQNLYRRLTPAVDSVVPVLDQWIEEGGTVDRRQLYCIIKEMRHYKRFKHALEISMWMSDKRYYTLSSRDNAIRLDLISKVHGIEKAEKYFDNIPERSRFLEVYGALLNCYAHEKSVEKAESVMQKMRDLGFARTTLCYNVMLSLYYRTGNNEKVDSLMDEMEAKGIECDRFTFGIRLSAYAAASDIVGMDNILLRMETSSRGILDWTSYACAASGYLRSGLVDKALEMLHKSEGLLATAKKRTNAYDFLLTQYAATGRKDEALRIWELYKKEGMVYNKGYISMLTTLLKFDDIEGAEKLFEEWESKKLSYDIRVPNYLMGAYCRKGLLEKAENLINNILLKGKKPPDAYTWYYLATGYLQDNQTSKAVETMRKALLVCGKRWKPSMDAVSACLKYLKKTGDLEGAEEFIRLLQVKEIIPTDIHDRLLNYFNNEESDLDSFIQMEEDDALAGDGETSKLSGIELDRSNFEASKGANM